MIFERAADKPHPVGNQRRRERIAGKALQRFAVKTETDGFGSVDQATARESLRAVHGNDSACGIDAAMI